MIYETGEAAMAAADAARLAMRKPEKWMAAALATPNGRWRALIRGIEFGSGLAIQDIGPAENPAWAVLGVLTLRVEWPEPQQAADRVMAEIAGEISDLAVKLQKLVEAAG